MRVDGMWHIELDIPAGPREGMVRLVSVGRSLSGSWSDGTEHLLFEGGTVHDESVKWAVDAPSPVGPVSIVFDGRVKGNAISGTVEVGSEGAAGLFRGERVSRSA